MHNAHICWFIHVIWAWCYTELQHQQQPECIMKIHFFTSNSYGRPTILVSPNTIKVCHTMINYITISAQTLTAKNHDANKFRQLWLVIHNFWSPVVRTRSFTIIEFHIQKPFQQATNEMNYYSLSISYYHTFWVLNM